MGLAKGCKLKTDAHNADLKLASMVPADVGDGVNEDLLRVTADGSAFDGAW